jgi:hypothetical protein
VSLTLNHCEWMGDWFTLDGGGNRSSVEGPAAEWREVAAALRAGKGDVHHKRMCAHLQDGEWLFWSPRNAVSDRDRARLAVKHGPALADHIEKVLAVYAEPVEGQS